MLTALDDWQLLAVILVLTMLLLAAMAGSFDSFEILHWRVRQDAVDVPPIRQDLGSDLPG